jgi:hypothetical protein
MRVQLFLTNTRIILYDGLAVLRTSFDTIKRIKQARNILELTAWAKHFEYSDLEVLRKILSML